MCKEVQKKFFKIQSSGYEAMWQQEKKMIHVINIQKVIVWNFGLEVLAVIWNYILLRC